MQTPNLPGAYYPQILEFTLSFWNGTTRWSYSADLIRTIRFKVLGQPFGKTRWRPHLIYHKDMLPEQTNKEMIMMLQKLQDVISQILNMECMPITKDLLDYQREELT